MSVRMLVCRFVCGLVHGVTLLTRQVGVAGVPVSYFRTYVGAARKAFRHGLLGPEELLRVIAQAQADLKTVARDDLKWADLRRDIDVALIELGRALEAGDQGASREALPAQTSGGSADTSAAGDADGGKKKGWLGKLIG